MEYLTQTADRGRNIKPETPLLGGQPDVDVVIVRSSSYASAVVQDGTSETHVIALFPKVPAVGINTQ